MRTKELIWGGIGLVAVYGVGRNFMRRIDNATLDEGVTGGVKVLLSERRAKAKATWEGDKEKTKEVINNPSKATLFVSNHPSTLEPFMLLASLPPKKDLSIIGDAGARQVFGRNFRKNFIPVEQQPRWETRKQKQQRRERNNKSLDEAVEKLQYHKSILIAPDGGDGSGDWKKGSSKLIESALAMPEAYLIMAHIPDSTPNEHWNLVFKRKMKRHVRISEPVNIQNLPIPEEIKQMPQGDKEKLLFIGRTMKDYYNTWATKPNNN